VEDIFSSLKSQLSIFPQIPLFLIFRHEKISKKKKSTREKSKISAFPDEFSTRIEAFFLTLFFSTLLSRLFFSSLKATILGFFDFSGFFGVVEKVFCLFGVAISRDFYYLLAN